MLLGIVTGVLTGLVASVIFWWWLARFNRPRIEICGSLTHYALPGEKSRCQVKIINRGYRAAVEIKVSVILGLPGLVYGPSIETVRLVDQENPWMDKNKSLRFGLRPTRISEPDVRRFRRYLPTWIVEAIDSNQHIDMAEFLDELEGAYIPVNVSAADPLSGARGYAVRRFNRDDIKDGRFVMGECHLTGVFDVATEIEMYPIDPID